MNAPNGRITLKSRAPFYEILRHWRGRTVNLKLCITDLYDMTLAIKVALNHKITNQSKSLTVCNRLHDL